MGRVVRLDPNDREEIRHGGGPDQVLEGKHGIRPVLQIQDHEIEACVAHDLDKGGVLGLREGPHDHPLRHRLSETPDGVRRPESAFTRSSSQN